MQKNSKKNHQEITDLELVDLINEAGDQRALRVLSDRHAPLFSSIVIRFAKRFNNWSIVPDLIDERDYVVYSSVKKYDPNRKTKFSTFLGNEAKWAYLNKCNAQKKNNKHIYTDNEILESIHPTEESPLTSILSKDTFEYIFHILEQHPDQRIKQIFNMRYRIGSPLVLNNCTIKINSG